MDQRFGFSGANLCFDLESKHEANAESAFEPREAPWQAERHKVGCSSW